jgi:hypothetical protein
MAVYLITTLLTSLSEIVHFDLDLGHSVVEGSDVTAHPVEVGADIVDHVRPLPTEFQLRVYVTNTPTRRDVLMGRGQVESLELTIPKYEPPLEATPGSLFRAAGNAIGAAANAIFGGPDTIKSQILLFPAVFDRVQEVEAQLTRLRLAGALLNLITPTKVHENLVITNVTQPREEYGGSEFSINLRQVRLVSNAVVAAPNPAEPRGAPGQAKGSQATKEVKGKDALNAKSWAASLVDQVPEASTFLFGG